MCSEGNSREKKTVGIFSRKSENITKTDQKDLRRENKKFYLKVSASIFKGGQIVVGVPKLIESITEVANRVFSQTTDNQNLKKTKKSSKEENPKEEFYFEHHVFCLKAITKVVLWLDDSQILSLANFFLPVKLASYTFKVILYTQTLKNACKKTDRTKQLLKSIMIIAKFILISLGMMILLSSYSIPQFVFLSVSTASPVQLAPPLPPAASPGQPPAPPAPEWEDATQR